MVEHEKCGRVQIWYGILNSLTFGLSKGNASFGLPAQVEACLVDGETKWRTRDALMSRLVRNKEENRNGASNSIIPKII